MFFILIYIRLSDDNVQKSKRDHKHLKTLSMEVMKEQILFW